MNRVTATDSDGKQWERVTKTRARKAWEAGQGVCFICCNFLPFGPWVQGYFGQKDTLSAYNERTFDDTVRDYEYYNCPDTETGKYCAFYLRVKEGKV